MRARPLLLIILLSSFFIRAEIPAADRQRPATEDPILLSKQIINAYPEHWSQGADAEIHRNFGLNQNLSVHDRCYLLLESPGLTLDYSLDADGKVTRYLPKTQLLELLKEAAESPEQTSRNIARATLSKGLSEFSKAFAIAGKFRESNQLDLEDAISFLDNRYGYAKLEDAKKLFATVSESQNQPLENKKVIAKLKAIEKTYSNQILVENALTAVYEFYKILEEEGIGLAAFGPYTQFKSRMEQLNKSRIAQRRTYRSAIKISEPNAQTVWALNEPVSLAWSTENIEAGKKLRFFLVRGEMVVQELGTFKNSGAAGGIHLNKNIDSGEDYRVVGIELFPANKYYVAKIATPSFAIRRPVRRKETTVVKAPPAVVVVDTTAAARMTFQGRKISYVKELTVNNAAIKISIWDHGRQDDDIVSIYLNGEPVVTKHTLTYRKKHFEVQLDPSKKNDLFLYAHNLGFYPPNTVSIEIVDGDKSDNIVLNSDLKSCEAVLINVNQ